MRSLFKIGAPLVVAALALSACGGTTNDAGATSGGKACDLKIGFFGALTGDAANLGINIKNGAELAVSQYNEKNADCKVTLDSFDSQGDPSIAPGLAQKAVGDKKLVGIVGPAFSGESKAADPIFEQAGLNTISASATNPALSENGWKTFHRVLGNDATQGPAAAKYIKDVLKADKAFVIDDSSEYGKGLADIVRKDLAGAVVGNDSIQVKQTDFSGTVTKVKASQAPAVFFGGYYAEAALIVKQLRSAGLHRHVRRRRRRQGRRLHQGRRLLLPRAPSSPARACRPTRPVTSLRSSRPRTTPTRRPTPRRRTTPPTCSSPRSRRARPTLPT